MKRKTIYKIIKISLPFIIVILLMTPRLASSQFGLLDDGAMLGEVRTILSGDFSMQHDLQAGRFRPLYWGYFTLIYALAGPSPFWFFFGHTVLFLILVFEIRTLIKQMGGELWQSLLACLVFIFSMPIIENFYTLSKGEPLQMVFVLLALIGFEKNKASSDESSKWPIYGLLFFSILAALLVKETTMVLLPIAVLWTGYGYLLNKKEPTTSKHSNLIFLGIIVFAIGASFLLRTIWAGPAITGGTYTQRYNLSLISLVNRLARWMTLYAYYFYYLIPLVILGMIAFFSNKGLSSEQRQYLVNWVFWALIWIVALIPWEYAEVYYLLPFSIGVALLIGLTAPEINQAIQQAKPRNGILKSLLGLTIVLMIMTLPNYYTHAGTQLIIDRTNQLMVESLQKNLPENGDAFIGMNAENEYVINTERFLRDQYLRNDIHYDFVSLETLGILHQYSQGILVLPFIQNQPDLIVRFGMEEEFTIAWREDIIYEIEDRLIELSREHGNFHMVNINLPVLLCPLLGERGFCEVPDPIIDTREFRYGWEIYQIR